MKFGTLFIALLLAGSTAQAQIPTPTSEAGPWSLDDCIRYAHEHNIQIQQQALQVEQRSVELNTSRHSRLPDLGANLGTNFSFGRSLISNNTYADNNQVSGSLGVSASLPVFMGGRINHEIAAGKLSLKAAAQDLDRIREDVSVNIMSNPSALVRFRAWLRASRESERSLRLWVSLYSSAASRASFS